MRLLEAAGLPPGVINLVTGDGRAVSEVVLRDPDLAGIHFTGSTATFRLLWRTVAENIERYRSYPRLVGETGGKDFVLAHPSADVDVLRTALVRGAFEYQGQKCSAASRAYVPRSVWRRLRDDLVSATEALTMGPVTDLANFMGAVIDDKAYANHVAAIERARSTAGDPGDRRGSLRRPGRLVRPADAPARRRPDRRDVHHRVLRADPRRPRLPRPAVRPGDAAAGSRSPPYALTGSIIAQDRAAIAEATRMLRFAAGNFYVNDKPTGAVVGQQPFGGARASGTNDKAGAAAEPAALDVDPLDQGDVHPADRPCLPAPVVVPSARNWAGKLATPRWSGSWQMGGQSFDAGRGLELPHCVDVLVIPGVFQ